MIDFKIYTSCSNLPSSWDSAVNHDLFLKSEYLLALENALPSNISLYYIGFFKGKQLVGVAVVQRVELYVKDMFRTNSSSVVKQFFINSLSKVLRGNILVVGNLTHTGQHALFYNKKEIDSHLYFKNLFRALKELKAYVKHFKKKKIRLVLYKDYFEDDRSYHDSNLFKQQQLHKVHVQPNMLMSIPSHWNTTGHYQAALKKKYRDRLKRARKKFGSIEKREMDVDSIAFHTKELHALYKNVSDNAPFNSFILPEHHFLSFKQQLKDNFKVFGYFLDDELVGFFTLIRNGNVLETYFLGYDKEHQHPNQLYLNMLYDMTDFGVKNQFKTVVYARTAMEIKSSIGALPKDMVMYMKHTNSVANAILKVVFNLMNPSRNWEQRHPFKT